MIISFHFDYDANQANYNICMLVNQKTNIVYTKIVTYTESLYKDLL